MAGELFSDTLTEIAKKTLRPNRGSVQGGWSGSAQFMVGSED